MQEKHCGYEYSFNRSFTIVLHHQLNSYYYYVGRASCCLMLRYIYHISLFLKTLLNNKINNIFDNAEPCSSTFYIYMFITLNLCIIFVFIYLVTVNNKVSHIINSRCFYLRYIARIVLKFVVSAF